MHRRVHKTKSWRQCGLCTWAFTSTNFLANTFTYMQSPGKGCVKHIYPFLSRREMPPKFSSKTKAKAPQHRSPAADLPQWPALRPLVPTSDLFLDTVLDDQIILIRNLFTSSLCRQYVSFLSSLPLITTPDQPKKGDALRVNDRFQVEDATFAKQLWTVTGLKDLVETGNGWGGEVCGLNPRIRIYRYRKNQFFDQHCKWCPRPPSQCT